MLTSCGLRWISWNILRDQPRHASAGTLSSEARGVEIDIVVTKITPIRNLVAFSQVSRCVDFVQCKTIDFSVYLVDEK